MKRILAILSILLILITPFSTGLENVVASSEDIRVQVTERPKVDVALTLGDTDIDVADFDDDLKSELLSRGVDPSIIDIQAFDATEISTNDADADVIFNEWENYPNDVGKWELTDFQGSPVIRSTVNTQWTGFWKEDNAKHTEITSELSVTTTGDDDWVGIAFRMNRYGPDNDVNPYNGNYDAYDMYFFGIDGGGSGESALFKMEKLHLRITKLEITICGMLTITQEMLV